MRTLMSFEVPIPHLEDFKENQDFIFWLSYLCTDQRYLDYLKTKRKKGFIVILDNSFEELHRPDEPKRIIDNYILRVKPGSLFGGSQLWKAFRTLLTDSAFQLAAILIRTSHPAYIVLRNMTLTSHYGWVCLDGSKNEREKPFLESRRIRIWGTELGSAAWLTK